VVWVEASQVPVRAFSAFGNDHFLHGRPYVASVGLYDHRARFYEARTGTFLEPDPLGPVDSPNLYQAFSFDALSVTDPWGLERRTAHGGVNPLGDILNEWQISSQTSWWQYAGLIALDVLGNTVSDLLSLDVVADEAAVLGSSQESLGRRLWAGTKLAGITALNAGGGDVAVKALLGRLARWAPVQRLAQRLGPKLSSAFTRRADEALSRADDLLAGERITAATEGATEGAQKALAQEALRGEQAASSSWLDFVPPKYRSDVARAFAGTPEVVTLSEDLIVYRYWGPGMREVGSPWFSPKLYVRRGNARRYLALPEYNPAEYVSVFKIPRGTTVIRGKVASQVGEKYFGPYATGGGMQIYLPDPKEAIWIGRLAR
jgi:RHS repeat-associated protein